MSEIWQAESVMPSTTPTVLPASGRAAGAWRAFAAGPISKNTWLGFAFLVVSAPIGLLGFAFAVVFMMAGIGMAITFLGLPIIAVTVLSARQFGRLHRSIGRRMVGVRVDDPAPFQRRPGLLGWLGAALSDATGWRSL